ncbi:MAG: LysR family transcriptional regulator [Bordetella sp.]|nr:LysR family transcriptional regulator [Bordetella sp.]
MRDLDLTSLRLFVAVCETRNIARAGEQQHIVASAISKRLAQLEATVGAQLFERRRRGVVPTPAGEILLEHARGMLAGADRVARDMAAYGRGVKGLVRMLATVSTMAEFLPDDIARFLQVAEHREIRVDIEEALSRDLVRAIREGSASLGVCWDAADLEGLQTRTYRHDQLAIIAPRGHPLAKRPQCRFEDTLGDEHVGLPGTTAVHSLLARAAAIVGRPLHYRAVVSTFDASLRCVRAGLGIAVMPREVAEPLASSFHVEVVPLSDPWAQRRLVICFRDQAALSPAARLLVEHLEAAGRAAAPPLPEPARRTARRDGAQRKTRRSGSSS